MNVWISSVLIAPALFFIFGCSRDPTPIDQLWELIPLYLLFAFFEFLFSLFTWLIFWMIIEVIVGIVTGKIWRKCLTSITGIGLTIATFYVFPFFQPVELMDGSCALILSNCACIAAASWCFKVSSPFDAINIRSA
jgi:hypothetical protein